MQHFNYIFTGSGLSALMTVYEMVLSGQFADKTILMLDVDAKKTNDRTWCFWDNKSTEYEHLIAKKWHAALFADENISRKFEMKPYSYNMIRGLDFYDSIFKTIANHKNIVFKTEKIKSFTDENQFCLVETSVETYKCDKVFNSIFEPKKVLEQTKYPLLQQHFIGWFIKTNKPVFDENCASFMDFSVEQRGNTRFMYVLPTSPTEALVEYTLFSKDLLKDEEYEAEIKKYIKDLGINDFEITDTERGNIPMTCFPFWKQNTKNIVNIGSAGGWTKASTGFTFKNTSKNAKKLVLFLTKETDFRNFFKKDKFWFYDLIFIDVLYKNNEVGSRVFASLFKIGQTELIFKFLDQETSFWEDLQVMLKCPTILFTKAVFRRLFERIGS